MPEEQLVETTEAPMPEKEEMQPDVTPKDVPPEPFPAPVPMQIAPPTDAQYAWFQQNPSYVRISHALGSYTNRGTLSPDGMLTPEGPGSPVLDGNGSFGVGIAM